MKIGVSSYSFQQLISSGEETQLSIIKKAKEMGFSEMAIGVDKDNIAALNLYKKFGFTNVLFDGADEDGEYFKLMKTL